MLRKLLCLFLLCLIAKSFVIMAEENVSQMTAVDLRRYYGEYVFGGWLVHYVSNSYLRYVSEKCNAHEWYDSLSVADKNYILGRVDNWLAAKYYEVNNSSMDDETKKERVRGAYNNASGTINELCQYAADYYGTAGGVNLEQLDVWFDLHFAE